MAETSLMLRGREREGGRKGGRQQGKCDLEYLSQAGDGSQRANAIVLSRLNEFSGLSV